jgi:hypothetical protein
MLSNSKKLCILLPTVMTFSKPLKMTALCSSDVSINIHGATEHNIPEYGTLHDHCSENLAHTTVET